MTPNFNFTPTALISIWLIFQQIQEKIKNWEGYADAAGVSDTLKNGVKSTLLRS